MSLTLDNDTTQPRRPIWLGVVGLLLLVFAAIVYWIAIQDRSAEVAVPSAYQYTINQAVNPSVKYMNSSFFDGGPGPNNTAYIAELTDSIRSQFHYNFTGSKPIDLTYTYNVAATIRGLYTLKEQSKAQPTVWTKQFQLVEPTTEHVTAKSFTLDPTVDAPFSEYKKLIDQFNTALDLTLTSEVSIVSTVTVSGTVDGADFKDTRVASVVAPLNQQLYDLAVKYDKTDTGQVAAKTDQRWTIAGHYLEIAAGAIALVGLVLLVYGFRAQIFKTPYQRERDRIFRFHDGIIIRASKPANLKGKNVVGVQSFDDILNLEEELKVPIVAAPAGAEATQFIILRDDVAYVYTLGKPLLEADAIEEVSLSIDEETGEHHKPKRKKVQ
jgi:hypothetical protein